MKILKNYKAKILRLDILADVFEVDYKNKYICWYDNQYSRTIPPEKEYEVADFDEIELYKKFRDTNIWEQVKLITN